MKRFQVFLIGFIGLAMGLRAQQARQYSFTQYTTANGLSSNNVNAVSQDKKGYIWLATSNGLQRFDGSDFTTFRYNRQNKNGIPSNNLATLFCDSKGRIWLVDEANRVGIFDGERFTFKEVGVDMPPKTHQFFHVSHFREDWDGRIFLLMISKGIYELDQANNRFVPVNNQLAIPQNWNVLYFQPDQDKKVYWIGCDSGLIKYDPVARQSSYSGHNVSGDPIIEAFAGIQHIQGILPIKGSKSLLLYQWPTKHPVPYLYWWDALTGTRKRHYIGGSIPKKYHEYRGATQQKNGTIWLYGLPFIAEFDTTHQEFQFVHQSAPFAEQFRFDVGTQVFEDRQQNLWLATTDGLFVFNPAAQAFNAYYLLRPGAKNVLDGPVEHVKQLRNGQIWVGTWGVGLYIYDSLFQPLPLPEVFKPWKDSMNTWFIHEHSKTGWLFFGEQSGYLKVYDPRSGKLWNSRPAVFKERTIRQIVEDQQGNIWFGTQGGRLIKWDYQKSGGDYTKGYELIKEIGLIHKLLVDTDGTLWVVTLGWGTYHLNPATGKVIDHVSSSSTTWKTGSDSPTDILRYNDSIILLATGNLTLLNTRNKTHKIISTDDGLPSNTAFFIQKDKLGRIWIGMENGLCRWNIEKNTFTVFDRRDGIQFDNFTSGGAFCLRDSLLVFTTSHNFLVFNPANVLRATLPPRVTLTGMQILNRQVNIDSILSSDRLELTHQNNSITIDYSSLQYLEHGQISYYHQLEGLDDTWVKSTRNQAIYNYLPYRNYRFRVKAVNADGEESETITQLLIQVRPPFWRTYWFMAMMVFLAIAFLYWLDRLRMQKLRATERIRNRIASSLTQDLAHSLSSINISSELAKKKIEKDTPRTKDYIDHISETSNRMTQAMQDMVWSIDPQNDLMANTLQRMKQFTQEQEAMYGIPIHVDTDPRIENTHSDMEHRYELLAIFKEALTNAVKHAGASQIQVQLSLRKQRLHLTIQDDGIGFDPAHTPLGRGISDMKRRASALQARLEILSEKNMGTLVRCER